MKGVVEFFNNARGWGIIKGEDNESFFIHHQDIRDTRFFPDNKPDRFRTLKDGEAVIFEVDSSGNKKHPAAKHLIIAKKD